MARRFAKVSEEEIVAINCGIFYPSDLVNTKRTIPSGSEKIYTHHYSPPLRGIVVYNICFVQVLYCGFEKGCPSDKYESVRKSAKRYNR